MKQEFSFSHRMGFSFYKEQRAYLFSPSANSYRLRLLAALVSLVADHDMEVKQERFHLAVRKGQVVASEIELARIVGCNRKTIHLMLSEFERLGLSTSVQVANRTTVHTLYFVSGWKDEGVVSYNGFFDKNAQETATRLASFNEERTAKVGIDQSSVSAVSADRTDSDITRVPFLSSPTEVEEQKEGTPTLAEESTDSSVHTSGCPIVLEDSADADATSLHGVSVISDMHEKPPVATSQGVSVEYNGHCDHHDIEVTVGEPE